MEWNDTAIVLKTGRFREADMWLRLLSPKKGIITVFAFGASRSKRRFLGCLDVLNIISCRVKSCRYGQYLALEESSLQYGAHSLRHDMTRLGMLMNCIHFLEAFGVSQDGAVRGYALLQEMLMFFEKEHLSHNLYPMLFRLRMASEQGFAPHWRSCSVCAKPLVHGGSIFYMNEGITTCLDCKASLQSRAYSVELSSEALWLLHRVEESQAKDWDVLALSPKDRQLCFRAIDGFIQFHLGIAWEDGRFKRV